MTFQWFIQVILASFLKRYRRGVKPTQTMQLHWDSCLQGAQRWCPRVPAVPPQLLATHQLIGMIKRVGSVGWMLQIIPAARLPIKSSSGAGRALWSIHTTSSPPLLATYGRTKMVIRLENGSRAFVNLTAVSVHPWAGKNGGAPGEVLWSLPPVSPLLLLVNHLTSLLHQYIALSCGVCSWTSSCISLLWLGIFL